MPAFDLPEPATSPDTPPGIATVGQATDALDESPEQVAARWETMTAPCDKDWFQRVPKVELHLHLEGAIPRQALWELIRKYGGLVAVQPTGAAAIHPAL